MSDEYAESTVVGHFPSLCLTSPGQFRADEAEIEPGTAQRAPEFAALAVYGATTRVVECRAAEKHSKPFTFASTSRRGPRPWRSCICSIVQRAIRHGRIALPRSFSGNCRRGQVASRTPFTCSSQESPNLFAADLRMDRPEFTQKDLADVERFRGTAAGQKYRQSDLVHSDNIRGPVMDKIKATIARVALPSR